MFNMIVQPEKIVDFAIQQDGIMYYQVKWCDSWVAQSSLSNAWQHLIESFWKNRTETQQQRQEPQPNGQHELNLPQSLNDASDQRFVTLQNNSKFLPNFSTLLVDGTSHATLLSSLENPTVSLQLPSQPDIQQPPSSVNTLVDGEPKQNTLNPATTLNNGDDVLSNHLTNISADFAIVSLLSQNVLEQSQSQNVLEQSQSQNGMEQSQIGLEKVQGGKDSQSELLLSQNGLEIDNNVPKQVDLQETDVIITSKNDDNTQKINPDVKIETKTSDDNKNKDQMTCSECSRDFSQTMNPRKRLREHFRRIHLKNGKFRCSQCPKSFVCRQGLRDHEPVHSKERKHACTYCGQTFLRSSHLYIHTRTHEEEKTFRCEACLETFNVQSELKNHCDSIHLNISIDIKCSVCKQNLFSSQSIYSHSLRHSGTRDWKCDDCGAAFKRKQILDQHKKRHEFDKSKRKNSKCDICSKDFTTRSTLREHVFLVHNSSLEGAEHKCVVCGKCFKNWANYNRHISLHPDTNSLSMKEFSKLAKEQEVKLSQQIQKSIEEYENLNCQACKATYTSSQDLIKHLQEHQKLVSKDKGEEEEGEIEINSTAKKGTSCEVCNKTFSSLSYLKKHVNMHSTLELKCDVCCMNFKRRDTLRIHKKRHVLRKETPENFNGKPGEIYNSRRELHAKIGEADSDGKVTCPYCEKVFNKRKLLLAHIVLHGDVDYTCDTCGKSYKQRSCLNKHKRSHQKNTSSSSKRGRPKGSTKTTSTSVGKYKCLVCTEGFNSQKVLAEHRVVHTTLVINCQHCSMTFVNKETFERHLRGLHRNRNKEDNESEATGLQLPAKLET